VSKKKLNHFKFRHNFAVCRNYSWTRCFKNCKKISKQWQSYVEN